jgi:hypothetical protein
MAPSNPSNRVDDFSHANDQIYVRNVGCPFAWPSGYIGGECPESGAETIVEIASGGEAAFVFSHDSSIVALTGGTIHWGVRARDTSSFTMTGGSVGTADASVSIYVSGSASADLTGGALWGSVSALDSANLLIDGVALMDEGMTFDVHDSAVLEIDGLAEVMNGAIRWMRAVRQLWL